jgi:hypothetical protein
VSLSPAGEFLSLSKQKNDGLVGVEFAGAKLNTLNTSALCTWLFTLHSWTTPLPAACIHAPHASLHVCHATSVMPVEWI